MQISAEIVKEIKSLLPNGGVKEIALSIPMDYWRVYAEFTEIKEDYDDRVIYAALRKLDGLGYNIERFGVKLEDQK